MDQHTSAATTPPARGAWNETRKRWLATDVEVAGSVWARFKGLMLRRELPRGRGLWLPGDNGIHMFFMRFAIDAVFLGRPEPGAADGADGVSGASGTGGAGRRRVVATKRRLRPWLGLVPYVGAANGVLELPAGTIDDTGTQVGDVVQLA